MLVAGADPIACSYMETLCERLTPLHATRLYLRGLARRVPPGHADAAKLTEPTPYHDMMSWGLHLTAVAPEGRLHST